MHKKTVAVLFGGCSEERAVSVKSAMEIAAGLDPEKYDPIYIGITKSGGWKLCETPCPGWEDGSGPEVILSPDREPGGLLIQRGKEYERRPIDVVFPALHGKWGEDGAVQGLLELSGIPYVGCDIASSVLCMDKALAYIVASNAGVNVPGFQIVRKGEAPDMDAVTYPVFVKPARSGSSFGVTRVDRPGDLAAALEDAGQYDDKLLLEQAISGCEVGCAVLGNGGELVAGEVDQIRLTHGIFRIHQEAQPEKGSENAIITVPADIPEATRDRVRGTAKKIYRALGCRGLARVDLFLQEDGRMVLNEVNTLPGFTSYSRYPRMMAAAGIALPELIDRLITLALER